METPERFAGPHDDPFRYALWGQIGGGAEGRVWRATRQLNDGEHLDVAVKVLDPDRFGGIETPVQVKAKWSDQAARLRTLKSTGIVSVQETFEGPPPHGDTPAFPREPLTLYFVMGWVEGNDLASWAAAFPGGLERLAVLEAAADGLDELHTIGQAHADIKPSNMIVTTRRLPNGQAFHTAVLVDFGLMRTVTRQAPSKVAGSPGYWAPELHRGGSYSAASDLYAFAGVVLYLLTDSPPPAVGDVQADARRRLIEAGVGQDAVEAITAALDPNPHLRPESGVRTWLTTVRSGFTSSVRPTIVDAALAVPPEPVRRPQMPRPAPSPNSYWHRRIGVLTILAGLCAGVWLALSLRDRGSSGSDVIIEGAQPGIETSTTLEGPSAPSTTEPMPVTTTATTAPRSVTTVTAAPTAPATVATTTPRTTSASTTAVSIPPRQSQVLGVDIKHVNATGNTWGNGAAAISGQRFDQVVRMGWCSGCLDSSTTSGFIEYDVGRTYATFRTVAGQVDTSTQTIGIFRFDIFLDGVNKYSREIPFGVAVPIELDVTGVLRIRMSVTLISSRVNARTGFGDPTVFPA